MSPTFKTSPRGFSTIEMLVAMAILIITVTAVILVSFGGVTLLRDAETGREALSLARLYLSKAQTDAQKDFQSVNPTTTLQRIDSVVYQLTTTVTPSSDHLKKLVRAHVSYPGEHGTPQHVELSGLVTNFIEAPSGSTCDSALNPSAWQHPLTTNSVTDFLSLIATSTGINVITSIDARKGLLYVTVGNTTYKTDPTFFIFDIAKLKSDPTHALLGKIDPAQTTMTGLYAVHVAETDTTHTYAFTANEYGANWSTCAVNYNCAQLFVIDVSDPSHLTLASAIPYKLPNVSGNAGGIGTSIFYQDGLVYLGLSKTSSGPEFNVLDVHDPLHPKLLGSYAVGATVNAIVVSHGFAYLATTNNANELLVLDVSNPVTPKLASYYNAPGQNSAGYGLSLSKTGDMLALGRTYVSNAPELMILDASTSDVSIPNPPMGTSNDGTPGSPFSIAAILVRDSLLFMTGGSPSTGGALYIKDLSGMPTLHDWVPHITLPNGAVGSALDCEGNDIFVASNDSVNNGYLSIITSQP